MKKIIALVCLSLSLSYTSSAQKPAIIPIPTEASFPAGKFTLPTSISISGPSDPQMKVAYATLVGKLKVATGRPVSLKSAGSATIQLQLVSNTKLGSEGYELQVNSTGVKIKANKLAGLFYGIQTLYQLLPKEIESKSVAKGMKWTIPYAQITDTPRFAWRGQMFDVARHFFSKEDVKKFIDDMVEYKYNILHFHLTDDEGWRIEIKSYPNLTKKGAFNVKKVGRFTTFSKPEPNEPRTYGGFYTQEDIKELVKYGQERFVNIVPEIDVPGHSMAAVASYPELSCTPGADKYEVISGEPFIDWSHGHPEALQDNTLCPANENVYTFLDKVMGEVASLFPYDYIHMGGDECPKNYWDKNPEILALRAREGLKNSQEVQAYFVRRLEKIISGKGKRMLGWDEILEGGGLPKGTSVMSWRGIKGGVEAAKLGHEVVMTPNDNVYVDLMQGDIALEPPVYRTVRLTDSYAFNPVPDGVDAKLVKGGQANMWSEQLYNYRHLQYMMWPRALAISESLWSPNENKNWDNFISRVEEHMARFDVADKKYAPSMYEAIVKVTKNSKGELFVELKNEISGLKIHYSFDNSYPDNHYPSASGLVAVPKDAELMRIVSYRGTKMMGRMMNISRADLAKRAR
ncbi:beta-N-acetylhexosaminidase [Aquirufa novilacunae]|jgi:hexosaminidase|uniref:beta-N-acetylhexosaminidase n=1 Tax=Aquirufa novilacunae TaxID=3139305 RepID=A0ABW8TZ17_9BACT